MKIYTVYLKPEGEKTLQSAVLVPEGFSWPALIPGYNLLWAFMHKCWVLLFVFIFLYILSFPQSHLTGHWQGVAAALKLVTFVFLAIWANDLWALSLKQAGYHLAGVVSGKSEAEAQLRFFEEVSKNPYSAPPNPNLHA